MALKSSIKTPGTSEPEDYARAHLKEGPSQLGLACGVGRGARIAGWVVAAILVLMTAATNYQFEYHLTLWVIAAVLVSLLLLGPPPATHQVAQVMAVLITVRGDAERVRAGRASSIHARNHLRGVVPHTTGPDLGWWCS